ncbi:hypothetical protein Hanom_Chr12g01128981 [Helianthus anomalus]
MLVAAHMSDQWPEDSTEAVFPTFGGTMGVRPLESREQLWYERIKVLFLYPPAGAFANPPIATEGAHLPNPSPFRVVTSVGKKILYLSSEESVGSSNGEISSWSNIFVGVLRDLGIDPEEKKKKPSKKKKVITIDAEVTSKQGRGSRVTVGASDKGTLRFRQSNLEDYVIISDSLEGFSRIGDKKKTRAAGSKSSGARVPGTWMLVLLPLPSRLRRKRRKKKKKKKSLPSS